jgi:DNA ligase (NAD+)
MPECQTELVKVKAKQTIIVPTLWLSTADYRDPAFYFRKAMDIEGLGGETVALLFNNGLVHNYADLYELTVNQILPLERWLKIS